MTIEPAVIEGIRTNTDMVMLVGQTVALKKRGNIYLGLCPEHREKTPSFKVDNGRHTYHCFGCGFAGDAIAWVQWRDHITFPEAVAYLSNGAVPHVNGHNGHAIAAPAKVKAEIEVIAPVPAFQQPPDFHHPRHGKPTTVWTYRNAAGDVMNYVARYDPPGEKKQFSPWSWTASGWAMKGLPMRPLYGAELLAANPQAEVVIVEGEKAADAARTLLPDHVCVTWHGGTQALKQTDWEPLKGRAILVWPDADEVGATAAKQIVKLLGTGRILVPPAGVESGWDAADATAEQAADMLVERLPGLIGEDLRFRPSCHVLIVDGARNIAPAAKLFPAHVVISWSGDHRKVDWAALGGRHCILWPSNSPESKSAMAAIKKALK